MFAVEKNLMMDMYNNLKFYNIVLKFLTQFKKCITGASGMVGQHPCYSQIFNKGGFIASHPMIWLYVRRELRII